MKDFIDLTTEILMDERMDDAIFDDYIDRFTDLILEHSPENLMVLANSVQLKYHI